MSFSGEVLTDSPVAYWKCQDAPSSTVTTRTNLSGDPSVETTDMTGWATYAGWTGNLFWSGARSTLQAFSGTASYRAAQFNSISTYNAKGWILGYSSVVELGTGYIVSAYVRPSRTLRMSLDFWYYDDQTRLFAVNEGPYVTVPANTWTRLSRAASPPDFSYWLRPTVAQETVAVGDVLYADAFLIQRGNVLDTYFDGSTPGGGRWLGTPGKSVSAFDTTISNLAFNDFVNSYNGTITSTGTSLVTGMGGIASSAMQFTTAGQATVSGSSGVWNFGLSSDKQWSIEMIARFDTSGGGTLLSTEKWKIASFGSNAIAFMPIGSSTGTGPTSAWAAGSWRHLVVTFDGVTLRWYVNGTNVLTSTTFTPFTVTGANNLIFTSGTAASLDEVAIYNRVLSPSRVLAHFNNVSSSVVKYVTAIRVDPTNLEFIIGQSTPQQLVPTALYSDGTTASMSGTAQWVSTDTTVVTVNSSGLVTPVAVGTAAVEVTVPGLSAVGIASVLVKFPPQLTVSEREIYSDDSQFPVHDDLGDLIGTTGEYWEVDQGRLVSGRWVYDSPVSLATYAWNISTIGGREGIPVSDGENVRLALRSGRRWIPKTPDQKPMSLAMWVQGTDEDGNIPDDVYVRTKFWENYNSLKKLFAVWDRQLLLRRRIPSKYGIQVQESFVEVTSNMDISPTGPLRGAFTVDLVMADPFWYGSVAEAGGIFVRAPYGLRTYNRVYPLNYGAFSGETGILELNNEGTHDAKLWAEMWGPLTNPSVTNLVTGERFRLEPDVPISKGTSISVDFSEMSINLNGTGSRYWWMDRTTSWLRVSPGTHRLQFAHDGPERTGYILWRWQPSYL